jgi:hypothetical protein
MTCAECAQSDPDSFPECIPESQVQNRRIAALSESNGHRRRPKAAGTIQRMVTGKGFQGQLRRKSLGIAVSQISAVENSCRSGVESPRCQP